MKGKICFQCLEGAYVCQILPTSGNKGLIDALPREIPGFKFHSSPTSENFFFGFKNAEFAHIRTFANETGEVFLSPIDRVSGEAFKVSESALISCLGKLVADRGHAATSAKQKAALAAAEKAFTALPVEDRAKLEFENSAELRSEFTSLGAYTAYRRADEMGRVKIFRKEK